MKDLEVKSRWGKSPLLEHHLPALKAWNEIVHKALKEKQKRNKRNKCP